MRRQYLRPPAAAALALAVSVVPAAAQSVPALPAPTGGHRVGTALWIWPDDVVGEIAIRAWYPAGPGGAAARWIPLQERSGEPLPPAAARALAHARLNAPLASSGLPFPVAIVSHAPGASPSHYAALGEELASHGWVVLAPYHPGAARSTPLGAGGTRPMDPSWPGARPSAVEAALDRASDLQRRLVDRVVELGAEAPGAGGTGPIREFRAGDGPGAPLAGRLDAGRIAVVGHAEGGSATVLTARRDRRVGAFVSLDGPVTGGGAVDGLHVPGLFLEADPRPVRPADARTPDQVLDGARLEADGDRLGERREALRRISDFCLPVLRIRDAPTGWFSDVPSVLGEPDDPGGPPGARVALELSTGLTRAFLNRSLGRGAASFAALAARPEVVSVDRCAPEGPVRERSVRADGARLSAWETGSGPETLVVVHGGPSPGHGYLLPWLSPLAEGRRLVFYDQRGVGASSGVADTASMDLASNVADLEAVRRSTGAERVDLLAHSYGAAIALAYAARHPERVRRLVLLAPAVPGPAAARARDRTLASRRTPSDSAALAAAFRSPEFAAGERAGVDRVYELTYRPWFGVREAAVRLGFGLDLEAAGRGRAVARHAAADADDAWRLLGRVAAPVMVLHGTDDPIPLAAVEAAVVPLSDVTVRPVPGAGHFPFVERPRSTLGQIVRFLAASPPAGAREAPR